MQMANQFVYLTEDTQNMVTEKEAEDLAKKFCEDYMTACNLRSIDDAKLASQKMLAVAHDLFETMHNGNVQIDTIQ